MNTTRRALAALLAVTAAALFVACGNGLPPASTGTGTAQTGTAPGRITAEMYRQVETGMTYEQVKEIAGVHGVEQARTVAGGTTTKIISWANRDGGNMSVTFQGGRVITKAQAGLR